jgi:hypothetical protein
VKILIAPHCSTIIINYSAKNNYSAKLARREANNIFSFILDPEPDPEQLLIVFLDPDPALIKQIIFIRTNPEPAESCERAEAQF